MPIQMTQDELDETCEQVRVQALEDAAVMVAARDWDGIYNVAAEIAMAIRDMQRSDWRQ